MANVSALRATLDRIERDPESWHQVYFGSYHNGVARYCYAGHAAVLAGDPPDIGRHTPELAVFTLSGDWTFDVARRYLDVTTKQLTQLVWPNNTLDDVRRLVAEFIAKEEEESCREAIASVRR